MKLRIVAALVISLVRAVSAENPPVVLGDTVFAASSDTQLYALDLRAGTRRWRVVPAGGSLGSLAMCA